MQLVSLSAVAWNFALVGRTRMLTEAWQRSHQPTTFVEVPSVRTALATLRRGGRAWQSNVVSPRPSLPARLWPVLPESLVRSSCAASARGLRRSLDRLLDWQDSVALVVSPVWLPWLDELPFGAVLYDCIDDLSVHVPDPSLASRYRQLEDELLERVAGAVVSAEVLGRGLEARRPGLVCCTVRNGVDAADFVRRAAASPRPSDLGERRRPRIGFVGALYDWIDWELIEHAATALPECDFIFVGPTDRSTPQVSTASNRILLGPRPYAEVPSYIEAFDVCWLPFLPGPVAEAANPIKLYEYLSLGKPVVATPIADPEHFAGAVTFARGKAAVVAGLRAALADSGDEATARREFAASNSWDQRAGEIARFAAARLAAAG